MVKMYVIIYLFIFSDLDTSHDGKCRVECNNSFHHINWTITFYLLFIIVKSIKYHHHFFSQFLTSQDDVCKQLCCPSSTTKLKILVYNDTE